MTYSDANKTNSPLANSTAAFILTALLSTQAYAHNGLCIGGPGLPAQQAKGRIILYEHVNFHGASKFVVNCEDNLAAADDNFFNDTTSSFVILSGKWKFFTHINYGEQLGGELGPGAYSWVEDFGILNDNISSLCLVGTNGC